jgi:hypothetical protein
MQKFIFALFFHNNRPRPLEAVLYVFMILPFTLLVLVVIDRGCVPCIGIREIAYSVQALFVMVDPITDGEHSGLRSASGIVESNLLALVITPSIRAFPWKDKACSFTLVYCWQPLMIL